MSDHAARRWDADTALLVVLAGLASVISFVLYFRSGGILLFGDAVAHMNIARRVLDSRTPGLLQLGTVWLPLPHLLMIPFVMSNGAWQSGLGGSLPSMAAYVISVLGIFRLVRTVFGTEGTGRITAWLAAAIYGLNPNLLYLQSTAMTETLYLAFFLWSLVYFTEFLQDRQEAEWNAQTNRSLWKCGACLLAACLTRYDGWFVAAVLGGIVILLSVRQPRDWKAAARFLLLAWIGPILWLGYNAIVYKNPLEFANGPYSAKAIEQRGMAGGDAPHPGTNNLFTAGMYFLKAAQLNVAEGNWGRWWLGVALVGSSAMFFLRRRAAEPLKNSGAPECAPYMLLLWLPLPFYMLSVAHGSVPIYTPAWWPFSLYNVRYGVQLLPALAVFFAVAVNWLASLASSRTSTRWIKLGLSLAGVAFVLVSYAQVWRAQPVSYREAWANSRTRIQLDHSVAELITHLPAKATILMYLGEHVGALQDASIPLVRTINEGNHRAWRQPSDPEGLWERALADPPRYADFAIAFEGDPVWKALHDRGLPVLTIIAVNGQTRVTIYQTRTAPRMSPVTMQVNAPSWVARKYPVFPG